MLNKIQDCKIINDNENWSDHLPVYAVVEVEPALVLIRQIRKCYLRWDKVHDAEIHECYTVKLSEALRKVTWSWGNGSKCNLIRGILWKNGI